LCNALSITNALRWLPAFFLFFASYVDLREIILLKAI